jgi:hypothetical protein
VTCISYHKQDELIKQVNLHSNTADLYPKVHCLNLGQGIRCFFFLIPPGNEFSPTVFLFLLFMYCASVFTVLKDFACTSVECYY